MLRSLVGSEMCIRDRDKTGILVVIISSTDCLNKKLCIKSLQFDRALIYMEVVPKNMAKETVSKMWEMCTVPRYKPPPKTKKYFVIPKSKSSKKKSNK